MDHIIPYRMFQSNDLRNLLSICRAPCHAVKTQSIEPKILRGDKLGFLQGLNQNGWPMEAVQIALDLFEGSPQLPLIGNDLLDDRKIRSDKRERNKADAEA